MANTRVKDLMAMIETELDPDQLEVLKFDLAQALGQKDVGVTPRPGKKNGVKRRSGGGSEMTDKQKKFAALAEPKDKEITVVAVTEMKFLLRAVQEAVVKRSAGQSFRGFFSGPY